MNKHFAVLFLAMIIAGCGDIGCGNEVASRVASPNGDLDAVVYNRNCGATTGFNTQLSIVPTGQAPRGTGTVLILDKSARLRIKWTSASMLTVSGVGSARVFHKVRKYKDVAISYEY